ncbi:hypothetical protein Thiowin_03416 [Thiorhodovibrio winogradskyi]|uniref:Uncharacterized protein n=2 Tax=Thiorhodovibrio winogradskyi TaxID=77007 RepID=A0ABZ0SCM6_9GAMM
MDGSNPIRAQLRRELQEIPDGKLAEILDLLHYFRLGLETEQRGIATSEEPHPKTGDQPLLSELHAIIRKPNPAPLGVFRLNLERYHFNREEANER